MNLNKVFLLGRLAADPEGRTTPSGQQVATLRIATNRVWNRDGQKQEQVEFHTVVAWGNLADIATKYLKKGQLAFFEGRLQTRSWQGQDGVKRFRTEVVAENLQLGPKSAGTTFQAPQQKSSAPSSTPDFESENIPVIEPDAPLEKPLGKEPASNSDIEEGEIDLKDIPF